MIDLPPWKFYRPADGHPDWQRCREEASALVAKALPVIRKDSDLTAADRARDALRKAGSIRQTTRNFFINRRRYRAGNHALRPLYVIWTTTNQCNFRCAYCDNHQGEAYFDIPDPNRLDTEAGKKLLDVMKTGTPAIYWCGGEPTMRKDLPELLDHAWRIGYFPNMINTNGSLLHKRLQDERWRDFLWQMDTIIVSMDGIDEKRLAGLWGVKNVRQVFTNLLLVRELRRHIRFKVVVNTVITPDTIEEARAVLNLACDLGVWFVPVPVNVRHEPNRELIDNPDYRALVETILQRKRDGHKIIGSERLLRRLLYAEPYTCFTALKPHVWSDGSICWPCRATRNVEPVDISLLDYGSFDAAYAAGAKKVSPHYFHGPAANQCGGQCAWMQNYTTARYMDGVVQPWNSGIVREIGQFALSRRDA